MNRIDIIPSEPKKQNNDRSFNDNSKVIKIKTEEIVAIDRKHKNKNKRVNDSSISIKTENNNEINSEDKNSHQNSKIKKHKMDVSLCRNSLSTKKIEEDLSIQDEIEIHNAKKNSNKVKNLNNKINEKEHHLYDNSFKKSIKNNSNISENFSYLSEKKNKKDLKIIVREDMNNKENSIDEIIDSKSLKEIENEINSDFKNDQPVIEESKKSIDSREHVSPKNFVSAQSRIMTENKYDKLEIINEESMDKSKSNLREINNKNNFYDKKENYENLNFNNLGMEIYHEERFDKNHNFDNSITSKSSKNLNINRIGINSQANLHETFDSLKSNTIKTESNYNEEESKSNRNCLSNHNPNLLNKTEENYEAEKNQFSKNFDLENEERGSRTLSEMEKSHISKYSTLTKKFKTASKVSHQMFDDLKEKALKIYYEEKIINRKKSLTGTEDDLEESFDRNNISQNKSNIKSEAENEKRLNMEQAKNMNIKEDNDIQEEEDLYKENNEKSIQAIKIQENENENEFDIAEENINKRKNTKNNAKVSEDSDAIEEENHLANNELDKKSFKSKKSSNLNKKVFTDNILIQRSKEDDDDIPFEENIYSKKGIAPVYDSINFTEEKVTEENNDLEIKHEMRNSLSLKRGVLNDIKNSVKINFLAGEDINKFNLAYNEYKEKLSSEQKITFKPKESINEYMNFFNSKILKITSIENNQLIGLCCLSYDNTWDDSVKLNINHISTINYEKFEDIVNLIIIYIKKNFICTEEIIIELHYEYKNSNFEINKEIRDLFKNKFNFKWNKLENKNGERTQKLSLILNNESTKSKNEYGKIMHCTLEINHFMVLNMTKNKDVNKNLNPTNANDYDIVNMNYFSMVSSLCQMQNNKFKVNSELLEIYDKDKIKVNLII